jgi:hypothetical protein
LAEHLGPILFWYHLFTTVTFSSGKLLQSSRKPHMMMSPKLHHFYKNRQFLSQRNTVSRLASCGNSFLLMTGAPVIYHGNHLH